MVTFSELLLIPAKFKLEFRATLLFVLSIVYVTSNDYKKKKFFLNDLKQL